MGSNWEMPKPIFRSSEGESVDGTVQPIAATAVGDEHETLEPVSGAAIATQTPTAPAPQSGAAPAIAEQPFISDAYTTEELGVGTLGLNAAAAPRKSGSAGFKVVLGLFAFFFLASVAAFLVWFFTFRSPE